MEASRLEDRDLMTEHHQLVDIAAEVSSLVQSGKHDEARELASQWLPFIKGHCEGLYQAEVNQTLYAGSFFTAVHCLINGGLREEAIRLAHLGLSKELAERYRTRLESALAEAGRLPSEASGKGSIQDIFSFIRHGRDRPVQTLPTEVEIDVEAPYLDRLAAMKLPEQDLLSRMQLLEAPVGPLEAQAELKRRIARLDEAIKRDSTEKQFFQLLIQLIEGGTSPVPTQKTEKP